MSKSLTSQSSATIFGDGFTGSPFASWSSNNTNAPQPSAATLQAGNNTIVVPSGLTISYVEIYPLATSTNGKSIKGVAGDTGLGGALWTTVMVRVPVVAGSSFVITSVGVETVALVWG